MLLRALAEMHACRTTDDVDIAPINSNPPRFCQPQIGGRWSPPKVMQLILAGNCGMTPHHQQPLDCLPVVEQDGRLLIRLNDDDIAASHGQLHFDFSEQPEASPAMRMTVTPASGTCRRWSSTATSPMRGTTLGVLLAEMGRPHAACTAFRRALAAEPLNLRAHYNLADTLDEMGRADEARAHWQAYLRGDDHCGYTQYARTRLA